MDVCGKTALHVASRWGEEEIAQLLIASVADSNVTDIDGHKALRTALSEGHLETIKLLIKTHTDIDQQEYSRRTALSIAVFRGDEALDDLRLDAGTQLVPQDPGPHCPFLDPEEKVSGYGRDAVLAALENENFNVVRMIMRFPGGRNNKKSETAKALGMLDAKDMDALRRWFAISLSNTPENRPDIVAFSRFLLELTIYKRKPSRDRNTTCGRLQ